MQKITKLLQISLVLSTSLALFSCDNKEVSTSSSSTNVPAVTTTEPNNSAILTQATTNLVNTDWPATGIPDNVDKNVVPVLRGLLYQTLPSFNPSTLSDEEKQVYGAVFETLTRVARDGSYVPGAAQSYEQSADGLTWIFHLRPNAQWQDGKPVTASDFVYAWQYLATSTDTARNYLLQMHVANAAQVIQGNKPASELGVKAVDAYTLQIQLERPLPYLERMVSSIILTPIRQDLVEKFGSTWNQPSNIIGNGAFQLVKADAQQVQLVKAKTYWNASDVVLEQVDFTIEGNFPDRKEAANKQLFDFASTILMEQDEREKLSTLRSYPLSKDYLAFDLERISNLNIRQAIASLWPLDLEPNFFLKATFLLTPEQIYEGDNLEQNYWKGIDYDQVINRAKATLTSQGYSQEHPLEIRYGYTKRDNGYVQILLDDISEFTGKLIKFTGVLIEPNLTYEQQHEMKLDMVYKQVTAEYNHVSAFLNKFTCNNRVIANYCNPEYDKLVSQANGEVDESKRKKLYSQAVKLINKDTPVIYILDPTPYYYLNRKLAGYNVNDFGSTSLQDLYYQVVPEQK